MALAKPVGGPLDHSGKGADASPSRCRYGPLQRCPEGSVQASIWPFSDAAGATPELGPPVSAHSRTRLFPASRPWRSPPPAAGRAFDLLAAVQERRGMTVIVVSHDPAVAQQADRVPHLVDGRIT